MLISFVTFIRMSGRRRSGRHGRPRRQDMPIPDDIPVLEESVGQANMAKPVVQQAIGALAYVMVGALRESMDILKAENQVQA